VKFTPQRLLAGSFLLMLLAFAFWAANNHRLKIDSDPQTYLRFAAALSRGEFSIATKADRVFEGYFPPRSIYKGTYTTLIHEGRGIAFYAIGYPLYLAAFCAWGKYAPFFANLAVFLALFALLAAVTRRLFAGHPAAPAAALMAPALYWYFNRVEIAYLLAPYRDPLSHALLLASLLAMLRHLEAPRRPRDAALAGLFLGLAVTVRETSALAALPLGLLWLRQALIERRLPSRAALAAAVLGGVLGVVPLLAQNYANSGNPFYPTQVLDAQVRMGNVQEIDGEKELGLKGLRLEHFRTTEPKLVAESFKRWDPLFTGLAALGLVAAFSSPRALWFLLPFIAVYTLFFGFWIRPMMRYIFVTQIAFAPLLAFGVARFAGLLGLHPRLRNATTLVPAAVLVVTAALLLTGREPGGFRVPQAEAFRRDLEAAVPAGALVIAERPMRDIIDYLSHAASVNPLDFVREGRGLTFEKGMEHYRRDFTGVYFLDTVDSDMRNGYDDTPVTRERLLKTYDLSPAAHFEAERYAAADLFGKPKATLWKVEPWTSTEVATEVGLPPAREAALLRLNARALADGTPVEVVAGGRTAAAKLHPGFNWLALEVPSTAGGRLPLRVRAGVPLPRDMAPRLYGSDDPIRLDIGSDAAWFDSGFFDRRLAPPPREAGDGRERGWVVDVPLLPLPQSDLVLSAEVSCEPGLVEGPCRLHLSGAGTDAAISLPPAQAWRTVSLRLGGPDADGVTAALWVSPDSPRLLVRRFIVSRLRHTGPPLAISIGAGDEPHIAGGLYVAEQPRGGTPARWTDGDGRLLLPAGASAPTRAHALTLRTLGPPPQVADRGVSLEMNGQAIGVFTSQAGPQESVFAVPAGLIRAGLNELRIRSAPWNPARIMATTDTRTLGIMLEAVRLEPR
jgi:hypothetical protein